MTTTTTNENPERHLIEGANILMKEFDTPVNYLSFLNEAIYWISEEGVSDKEGANRVYFLTNLIKHTLLPWLENKEDTVKRICSALKDIYDFNEYSGYIDEINLMMQGFAITIQELLYDAVEINNYSNGIQTMYKVGHCFKAYEIETKNKAA